MTGDAAAPDTATLDHAALDHAALDHAALDNAARLRGEQIRLIYGMVGMTVFPAISVACILVWALRGAGSDTSLYLWLGLIVGCKLFELFDARRCLARADFKAEIPRQITKLMVVHGIDAASWSLLSWIALDHATQTQAILIISVLSGVIGGAVSLLSPVLSVFAVYALTDLGILVPKFLTMGDPAYAALAVIIIPYIISMSLQARSSSKASRQAIELGFENLALNQRLTVEVARSRAAHKEALDANQAKSKFLAAASHDLRQPIHALGLFLAVLDRSDKRPDQQHAITSAKMAAAASAEMLNALLDFSRIEASVVVPQRKVFALQDMLYALERELAPLAEEKLLHYRSRETDALVHTDAALIELILRNLISNAIRYTEAGGVLVACRSRGAEAQIEVWDTGVGIPDDQYQQIFREFHQLGNPERDRRKGLGLGLAIASRLAETLGTRLVVSSHVGRGSVFRFHVPLSKEPLVVEAQDPEPDRASRVLPSHARILVLDDDETIRAGMASLLTDWGYVCDLADTLKEAEAQARDNRPDLLICDFRLRDKEKGTEAVAQLRALLGVDLPAILITGDTDPERLREAAASNLGVLHKPVAPEHLRKAIEDCLARQAVPETA